MLGWNTDKEILCGRFKIVNFELVGARERPDISDIYFTKVRQRNETEWPSPGIKFTVSLSISVFKKDKFLMKEK